MIYLGIDQSTGLIYQGSNTFGACVVWPTPIITPVSLVSTEEPEIKFAKLESFGYSEIFFREDAFDPISRIRRGRFYARTNNASSNDWWVIIAPPVQAFSSEIDSRHPHLARKAATTFSPYAVSAKVAEMSGGQLLVALGTERASTLWTIVSVETIHSGEELVTLKATQSLGVLPKVDWKMIPDHGQVNIQEALQTLEDDCHIASPESVVDRANEAATRVLNVYVQSKGRELQDSLYKVIGEMGKLPNEDKKEVAKNAADIVRLLHGRTKYAVQKAHNARPIREQDAGLALQCLGVMLCDIGWGTWA